MTQPLQIIMIDNYDSFTYNLVNQLKTLNLDQTVMLKVYRNDSPIEMVFSEENLAGKKNLIVISPGPGNPQSAGNTLQIINNFAGRMPILGICLGHQSIVEHFGGEVSGASEIIHGKADNVFTFSEHPVFEGLPNPFVAARYHSLSASLVPPTLEVLASTSGKHGEQESSEVMAVVHKEYKIIGFQFHPESILTTQGKTLLENSVRWLTR
ncbi:aminodeoxychorismate/anthranilate synthase component II [Aliikangiella sp. G2MR2-5]|uniref:anthranilate synthase component II n=1 Tax=Aliikangiella sp. G2MR2-5 TaxID=2788943 RepID=UPI0018AA99F9|nr:aminodeoxychorismate/anthranilate synthase component II [Aliikangiella sp. G2MR2-5]